MSLKNSMTKRTIAIVLSVSFLLGAFLLAALSSMGYEPDASALEAAQRERHVITDSEYTVESNLETLATVVDHAPSETLETTATVDLSDADESASNRLVTPFSAASFSPEEIADPAVWYAVPDNVVTLASTPVGTAHPRLIAAIQAAPANAVTHIMVPFHINTGNFGTDATVVGTRPGATVVVIGNHPTAAGGQSVISDTHGGTALSRTFRLRGNGTDQSALVFRNIILQKSASGAAAVPANPPAPLAIASQTGTSRGGGVAIENGAVAGIATGGGGHFILSNNAVIRNNSTDNNGPIDVQTNGRFTMMPGSLMHTNAAGNSGGAVNVNANARFNMFGGTIRDNLARGENLTAPTQRASGGAVIVQNGGTFNLHDGEIFQNRASLGANSAAPTATNAIVTSNGGAVFVTGAASTFNMYGGSVFDNIASRTRSSGLATGTTIAATTNRANYRAGNGGGIYLTGGSSFNMYGGEIHGNIATNEGTVTNTATAVNALNTSNGGGVYLTGTNTSFVMQGGVIHGNSAIRSNNNVPTAAGAQMPIFAGNGGGVHVFDGAQFTLVDGEVRDNIATATGAAPANHIVSAVYLSNGGGVFAAGANSRIAMESGAISNNHAAGTVAAATSMSGNGGGVQVINGAQFLMTGGNIAQNSATNTSSQSVLRGNGGGVYLDTTGQFNMQGGTLVGNRAQDGGGLFVVHANLSNVTMDSSVVLSENVAHSGARINTALAEANYPRISPAEVSISNWVEESPVGDGSVVRVNPHAFTNFDINASGPQFWRVTHEAMGNQHGKITTLAGNSELPIADNTFVPDGIRLSFDASPEMFFEYWTVGTREHEANIDNSDVPFDFIAGGVDLPLILRAVASTHVIGNFMEGDLGTTLTVNKVVTGDFANLLEDFEFTLFLYQDAEGQIPLEGSIEYILDGAGFDVPVTGTLELDQNGAAEFVLRHDQNITFDNVSINSYLRIIKTPNPGHRASFVDSDSAGIVVESNDTTVLPMTEDRVFDFESSWSGAPQTGLSLDSSGIGAIVLAALLLLGGLLGARALKSDSKEAKETKENRL
ncbi:MAG: hypothetical protein FWE26_02750 [Coriobacteriia bacterium]|nr:hypothetical protein [Coriobacteriia bacterium]